MSELALVGKAWRYFWKDEPHHYDIIHAETRSKAQAAAFRGTDGFGSMIEWLKDFSFRREKDSDLLEAVPMDVVSHLTEEEVQIIAHSHGNDSREPGFRSYYNVSSLDNESLNHLVELGIMHSPQETSWGGSWYYHLTRYGCLVAFSMLPIKRGKLESVMAEREKVLEWMNTSELDLDDPWGVSLEMLKVNPKLKSQLEGKQVYIYSGEWGMYWRPGSAGYTSDSKKAGVYDFQEAFADSRHNGSEKAIYYRVVK
jgi:hypothetical protein